MKNLDNHRSDYADSIAALELVETPSRGWMQFHLLNQRVFLRAVMFLACNCVISGGLMFLFQSGRISVHVKNLYEVSLFVCFFIGGLSIIESLNTKRALTVLISIAVFQVWQVVFYESRLPYVFYFVFASWYVFWWIYKEPEMMARFGLRKDRFARDILIGVAISGLLLVYVVPMFKLNGLELKFDAWKIAKHASNQFPQTIVVVSFFFAVWNRLQKKGMSQYESVFLLLMMINFLVCPLTLAFLLAGKIPFKIFFTNLFSANLLFLFVFHLSFKYLKNALPAVFLMTAIQELMLMAGVL